MELNLGSYLYGLAHEAKKNAFYADWLKNRGDQYLIFDNGADELGEGMKGDELWQLILQIQPNEIILPDVLGDTDATIKNSEEFYIEYVHPAFIRGDEYLPSIMAVPQGLTFDDYMRCYQKFSDWSAVDVIGIPYDIEFDIPGFPEYDSSSVFADDTKTIKRAKRRLNLLRYLRPSGRLSQPIHLLGMNNLSELRAHQREHSHLIRSNDTTAPFAAAHALRDWTGGESGEKDWPALDFEADLYPSIRRIAQNNLWEYFKACGDIKAIYHLGQYEWGGAPGVRD